MGTTNRKALKEWAVVIKALDAGKQILLLRKGGIQEVRGEFNTEPREFFLYPTYVHQQETSLQAPFHSDLKDVLASQPPLGKVYIQNYGRVRDVLEIKELTRILSLSDTYVWSPAYVTERFNWRRDKPFYALVLRVFRLPQPVELPVLEEYNGCRSWIDLEKPLPIEGLTPVLEDSQFEARVSYLKKVLETECPTP